MLKNYIRIEKTKILNSNTIISKLSFSRGVKKYFKSSIFFAKYNVDIQDVDLSILNIPVITNILPIAWAIGADIYVNEIDSAFLNSLADIKVVMKKWYPSFSFSTNIFATKKVINYFSDECNALLFSGGLDSTCSYIQSKTKKPLLIMIWGADIPLNKKTFWMTVQQKYEQFAKSEKIDFLLIKSNIRDLLDEKKLSFKFGRYCTDNSWWGSIQHGFSSLGLCAPLTEVKNIGILYISSSWNLHLIKGRQSWGSHPLIDNKLSWSNIRIIHYGSKYSRQEKIKYILKEYIKKNRIYPTLRVCYSQFQELNCGACDKCLRTITGLVLENIDPNECGFNIDNKFFINLKKSFLKKGPNPLSGDPYGIWKDIQMNIPMDFSSNMYDSKTFFNWFKEFKLIETFDKKKPQYWTYIVLAKLPENLQRKISKFISFYKSSFNKKFF
ncbi:MAG: hypothetical protein IAX21_11510 [Candidatus Bathyarchaeota archaeon]|nr:MAG: hypothetical protein IAX21_11510 [Candidatus Bathyarchaeota archaeon]